MDLKRVRETLNQFREDHHLPEKECDRYMFRRLRSEPRYSEDPYTSCIDDYVDDPNGQWVELLLCMWSDYTGTDVEMSNFRTIEKLVATEPCVFRNVVNLVTGSNGYHSVLIDTDYVYDAESENPVLELLDMIDGLFDYPIIDEYVWSDTEQELINEFWENEKRTVNRLLESQIEYQFPDLEYFSFGIKEGNIRDLMERSYRECNRDQNPEYSMQPGCTAWIDMEKEWENIPLLIKVDDLDLSNFDIWDFAQKFQQTKSILEQVKTSLDDGRLLGCDPKDIVDNIELVLTESGQL